MSEDDNNYVVWTFGYEPGGGQHRTTYILGKTTVQEAAIEVAIQAFRDNGWAEVMFQGASIFNIGRKGRL